MKGANTLLILAAALLFTGAATAQVTVLSHATVIDGTGADPQRDVTIVMENGRIRDMGPSSKIPSPAGPGGETVSAGVKIPRVPVENSPPLAW